MRKYNMDEWKDFSGNAGNILMTILWCQWGATEQLIYFKLTPPFRRIQYCNLQPPARKKQNIDNVYMWSITLLKPEYWQYSGLQGHANTPEYMNMLLYGFFKNPNDPRITPFRTWTLGHINTIGLPPLSGILVCALHMVYPICKKSSGLQEVSVCAASRLLAILHQTWIHWFLHGIFMLFLVIFTLFLVKMLTVTGVNDVYLHHNVVRSPV